MKNQFVDPVLTNIGKEYVNASMSAYLSSSFGSQGIEKPMKKKESISIFRKQSIAVVPYLTLSDRIARVMQAVHGWGQAVCLFSNAVAIQAELTDEIISEIRRLNGPAEEAIAD